MERLSDAAVRDLFARMRLRIEDLERENATLRAEPTGRPSPHGIALQDESYCEKCRRYPTKAARLEARRRSWRESQRRRKEKLREAA